MTDESKKVNIDWESIIEDDILDKEPEARKEPEPAPAVREHRPKEEAPSIYLLENQKKEEIKAVSRKKPLRQKLALSKDDGTPEEQREEQGESEEELLRRAAEFRRIKEAEAREREAGEKEAEKARRDQQTKKEKAAKEEERLKKETEARIAQIAAEDEKRAAEEALKARLMADMPEEDEEPPPFEKIDDMPAEAPEIPTFDEEDDEDLSGKAEDVISSEEENPLFDDSSDDDSDEDYDDDEEPDEDQIYPGLEIPGSDRAEEETGDETVDSDSAETAYDAEEDEEDLYPGLEIPGSDRAGEEESGDDYEDDTIYADDEDYSGQDEIPVKEDELVMDEEDFKDTVEVDLKTVDFMGSVEKDGEKIQKSLERKIKDLTERISDLAEEQEEAFRRISMAVGDSQLAIKSSDRSMKEVRRLKKETEDYFARAEEQLKGYRDEISGIAGKTVGEAPEEISGEISMRLSVIEDALDRDEEHQKGVLDSLDQLREDLDRLKESIEDLSAGSEEDGLMVRRIEDQSARIDALNRSILELNEKFASQPKAVAEAPGEQNLGQLEEKFEKLKRKLDEKLDFSDDRIELLKAFVAQNMDTIADQLKWFRQDLTEQLKKVDFQPQTQVAPDLSPLISRFEEELASVREKIRSAGEVSGDGGGEAFAEKIAEMESKLELHSDTVLAMEDSLSRLQEKMASRYQEQLNELLSRLGKIEKETGSSTEYQGRIELLEAKIEANSENMHLEMEVLAEEIKKDQAELEGAQERINGTLEKLTAKMEVNQDKVKLLVDEKLKAIETRLEEFQQSLTDTRLKELEDKFDSFSKALPEGLVDKLIPMEETLQELSGTLDSKLDPLRQEIAGAKSHIEKELMKVKESWDKLDQTISDSEGAMTIALRAKESLERIEQEVAQAVSRVETMISSISESSYKTDSNLEKINLTIKLIDEARERVKSVQDNIPEMPRGGIAPSVMMEEDLIFTPREILEDPATGDIGFSLDDLLRVMMKHEASDLHIKAGAPPTVRLEGELVPVGNQILSEEDCKKLVLSGMSPYLRKQLARRREVDFAYAIPEARFRVNAFLQKQSVSAAFRMLLTDIPDFEELHMPEVMKKLCDFNHGLILITGPAGSGKSTTMASMINYINETRKLHVVTIEDPIEFIHSDKLSIISQREIGTDTDSFSNALKQSLRQDPNVIMIGEMRDPETIMTAVLAAETGHLVMSSLHTPNTIQSISRIIDVFSGDVQKQFRLLLANNLRGVVSQRLLNRTDGTGRIPAVEVMVVTPTISSLILEEKTGEIYDMMNQGGIEGMQTFTQSLISLVEKGFVAKDEAMFHADQPTEFRLALEGHTGGGSSMQEDSLMSWL